MPRKVRFPNFQSHGCFDLILYAVAISLVSDLIIFVHQGYCKQNPEKVDQRTISFPTDHSVGRLWLLPEELACILDVANVSKSIGAAKGTVTVSVRQGYLLGLEINSFVFRTPAVLADITPNGLDYLMVNVSAMTEGESACNTILKFLPHFKGLRYLGVERSDATDAGLENARSLTELRGITAYMGYLHGAFLKDLSSLPHLAILQLGLNPIDQSNLSCLAEFKSLQRLAVSATRIGEEGVKYISRCSKLENLDLSENLKVNDNCMHYLLSLRNLKKLDLRGTAVTARGVKMLAPLRLRSVNLSAKLFSMPEIADLRKTMPTTQIVFSGLKVSDDDKAIFAPLH